MSVFEHLALSSQSPLLARLPWSILGWCPALIFPYEAIPQGRPWPSLLSEGRETETAGTEPFAA